VHEDHDKESSSETNLRTNSF